MENNNFVLALQEAKRSSEEYLDLESSLNSIQDFKNLTEEELFEINNAMISMLMFLVKKDNEELELYNQSFFNLPDDIHFGFFSLFSDEFSMEAFDSFIEKVNGYIKGKEELFMTQNKEYPFLELQGSRALMIIKALEAHFEIEKQNYEKALSLFLKLYEIDSEGEIKSAGIIGLLYVVLKKYKEFDELDKTCKYEDTLLDYVLALYLFKTADDKADAVEALREAILENPLVIEILKSLESEDDNLDNYNTGSIQEAQTIVKFIALLFDSKEIVEWFIKNSTDVFTEIADDDELQVMIQKHYTNEEIDEEMTDQDDDDDDDIDDNDGKIIKLYDK